MINDLVLVEARNELLYPSTDWDDATGMVARLIELAEDLQEALSVSEQEVTRLQDLLGEEQGDA